MLIVQYQVFVCLLESRKHTQRHTHTQCVSLLKFWMFSLYKKNPNFSAQFEFLMHRCSRDPDRIPPWFATLKGDTALNVTTPCRNSFKASPQRLRTSTEFKAAVSEDVLRYILTQHASQCTALHSLITDQSGANKHQHAGRRWYTRLGSSAGKVLDPIYKALPCGTLQTLSSPPAEQLCNFMQGCKDPVSSRLHHTSQSGSMYVWFGEVEVLELFLRNCHCS